MDTGAMELEIKKWISLFEEQKKSGMTKEKWCFMNGISRSTYYKWWKKVNMYLAQHSKLSSSTTSNNEACFIERPFNQNNSAGMTEQEYGKTSQARYIPTSINIRYGDISIDLKDTADEKQLSMILRVSKLAD